MFCKHCGREILSVAIVCPTCGASTDRLPSGMLPAGYIFSCLLPLLGGIIALYVTSKGKVGHGICMLLLAVLSGCLWSNLFF